MKKATFVIAVYNDTETLKETLINLVSTVSMNDVDIIVVDDSNNLPEEPFKIFSNLRIFHNPERKGVGYSLDFGIRKAETEVVFPLGCDIRFFGNWFDRFYDVVKSHPKAIICTATAGLNGEPGKERRFITGKENHYHGAHILFHITTQNNNRVLPFREYLEAKWNNKMAGGVEEVGCILGAFYGTHKSWYENISPWNSHICWGNLEPMISMAYYINNGRCLIDLRTTTGHIFQQASSSKLIKDLIYNKLMNAYLYLPRDMEETVFNWAKNLKHSEGSFVTFEKKRPELDRLRKIKNSLSDEEIKNRLRKTGVLD